MKLSVNASRTATGAGRALVLAALLPVSALVAVGAPDGQAAHASPGAMTFLPSADAFVRSNAPSTNFGQRDALRADARPEVRSYVRFPVRGLTGPVVRATLRVHALASSTSGLRVSAVAATPWDEATVTWRTSPRPGVEVGRSGPTTKGTWTSVDVTSLVQGDGDLEMVLHSVSPRAQAVGSRESAVPPRLELVTG